ncbi:MAG: hypothetical protein ABIG71_00485 [Candidatus Uhrbacteria bacterium]
MGKVLVGWVLLALVLIVGPIMLKATGIVDIGGIALAASLGLGVVLLVMAGIVMVISKLYVRTKASEAFVRTGMGGMKVIMDGGAIVIPVIHELVTVSLETLRLQVKRRGADALLTKDKLRADIEAEFFVRVQADDDSIKSAARSLGNKTANEANVKALIEDKLISALRTVAATKSLEELNSKRDEFVQEVKGIVVDDLKHNGFTLESATISTLDQADAGALRDDNVFDAEGKLTIARITQEKMTLRNQIEVQNVRERTQQDVEARKQVLALEQDRARAEAEQQAKIEQIQAEQQQVARQAQIHAEQAVQTTELERNKAIEVATQQTEQAKLVAEQAKQQAIMVAEQAKQQAAQVAAKQREIAVVEQEQMRVEAEKKQLEAEKLRELEAQGVQTVTVVETAKRAKEQTIIAAQADAEQKYVTAERDADAKAYAVKTDATARQAAADADAMAKRKKAEADRDAQIAEAAGEKAKSMVPVQVNAEQVTVDRSRAMIDVDVSARNVEIDRDRVETVLKPELEAREQSGRVAQEFELAKLRVDAEARVGIEMAHAVASFGQKFETTLYGTPDQMAQVASGLVSGMSGAAFAEGLFGKNGNGHAKVGIEQVVGALGAIGQKLGIDPLKLLAAEPKGENGETDATAKAKKKVIEAPKPPAQA